MGGEPQGVRKSTSRPLSKSFEKGFSGDENGNGNATAVADSRGDDSVAIE
jgi:hypothetical protein